MRLVICGWHLWPHKKKKTRPCVFWRRGASRVANNSKKLRCNQSRERKMVFILRKTPHWQPALIAIESISSTYASHAPSGLDLSERSTSYAALFMASNALYNSGSRTSFAGLNSFISVADKNLISPSAWMIVGRCFILSYLPCKNPYTACRSVLRVTI